MAPPPPPRTTTARNSSSNRRITMGKNVGSNNKNKFVGGAAARSAYFARREAAKVLRMLLQGDARQKAVGTIKSLVYSPSVRNKKATFALVCQTLKYLPVLKDVLELAGVMNGKWKRQQELIYVTTYDMLLGQKSAVKQGEGTVEKFLEFREKTIQTALAQLLAKKNAKCLEDLLLSSEISVVARPRYVRVNTLRSDVHSAVQDFEKEYKVLKDDLVPDLLVLPAGTDLHNHPLVVDGSVFLQGKASSMPPVALSPKPGWTVLDACAAPGNKTVQLAALMKGKGKIIACELNDKRVQLLEDTIRRSGASNVSVFHGDFLHIDSNDSMFSEVRAILLDPSCSGSGTSVERLDHLLPSNSKETVNSFRIEKLSAFQRKALAHTLSFPAVERIVYSTCSIHQLENEDVVKSVLPLATSLNFELVDPFPQWPHRGLPVLEESEKLVRTNPAEGMDGFFIALFVRKDNSFQQPKRSSSSSSSIIKITKGSCSKKYTLTRKLRRFIPHPCKRHVWLHLHILRRKKISKSR